jgi:DNA-binding transcriptional MerR regulator
MQNLTIGQLGERMGVPVTTLRYYERIGLLEPEHRNHSNYRRYHAKSLEKLKFIKEARGSGLTLEDIRSLFKAPPSRARWILEGRLAQLERKRVELAGQGRRIRLMLKGWGKR